MDADWSHDPKALPRLIGPIDGAAADLVIGSRYTKGGSVEDWGIVRRIISRGGSTFARIVLRLKPHDLTGGFKAWRATTLALVPFDGVRAGGYVFQIEMTYRASRLGARVVGGADHVPRPPRRPVEDEPPDRRRGAGRRREPALGRAARARPGATGEVTSPDRPGWRPGTGQAATPAPAGPQAASDVRVVMDLRPLQDPERAPLTAELPRVAPRRPRCRATSGRVVLVPAGRRPRRSDRALAAARGRRQPQAPADPPPPLGRLDRRPVRAPRRGDGRRLARGSRGRGRDRVPRRRRRAADRVGDPGGGVAAGPRPVGDARGLPGRDRGALRPATAVAPDQGRHGRAGPVARDGRRGASPAPDPRAPASA